jgi:hypothetical protein
MARSMAWENSSGTSTPCLLFLSLWPSTMNWASGKKVFMARACLGLGGAPAAPAATSACLAALRAFPLRRREVGAGFLPDPRSHSSAHPARVRQP